MPVCGSVGGVEPLWEWNGLLPREPFVENQCGGQERQSCKAKFSGGGGGGVGGRGEERQTEFLVWNLPYNSKCWHGG